MDRTVVIYVPLLDEGTNVWRPVRADWLGGDRYRIHGNVPDDEEWAFKPGTVAICKTDGYLKAVAAAGDDSSV